MRLAARLLVLVEEVDRVGAAEAEIDRVDVVGQRGDGRGEILGAERHPLAVRHLPAHAAEFEHEAEHLRVDEGIILADRRDLAIALGLIGVVAEADLPLRAVHVEAEEVRRGIDVGRLLRARGGVDEGQLGVGLGEVLHRDALVARQRRQQDLDVILLDQLAHGAHRRIRRRVGRGDDELQFLAAGGRAVFLHRGVEAGHAVDAEDRVGAFERRGDADLQLVGRERRAGQQQARQRGETQFTLFPCGSSRTCRGAPVLGRGFAAGSC